MQHAALMFSLAVGSSYTCAGMDWCTAVAPPSLGSCHICATRSVQDRAMAMTMHQLEARSQFPRGYAYSFCRQVPLSLSLFLLLLLLHHAAASF